MSREPNIQNVPNTDNTPSPKDRDYAKIVQYILSLGQETFKKKYSDWSGEGRDSHTMIAREALGVEAVTSEQRKAAKNAAFMFNYGADLNTLERLFSAGEPGDFKLSQAGSGTGSGPVLADCRNDETSLYQVWRNEATADLPIPEYKTRDAAGFDIMAGEATLLSPGKVVAVPTGLHMAFPNFMELQIRMRGGTAKRGILLANAPGTVDADYRGEIMLLLFNTTADPIMISRGERVCQGVFSPIFRAHFHRVETKEQLGSTVRDEGRFNSTGTT